MKDFAAEAVVEDFFAWRFVEGIREVCLWEVGWPKGIKSLTEKIAN